MPFDGGMTSAVAHEILKASLGAKIEKVYVPCKDELVLLLHTKDGSYRLSLCASAHTPRINFTKIVKENPKEPSAFCMQMRKHLTGARIVDVQQIEFDRIIKIVLSTVDELGFPAQKHLYCEIMGKHSNIILTNENEKIINVIKTVDFTTSSKRQLLPGMTYSLPPSQGKKHPLLETRDGFMASVSAKGDIDDAFLMQTYQGISPLISRELFALAHGEREKLWFYFSGYAANAKEGKLTPYMLKDASGKICDFTVMPISQYGKEHSSCEYPSFGELIDAFYEGKEKTERIKQLAKDVFNILSNAEARLKKKIASQKQELIECAEMDKFKLYGDLITANLYAISRGMAQVKLVNYYDDECPEITIELDSRISPSSNAQKYYKKYTKLKTAKVHLAEQIAIAEKELEYIYTVFDSLTKAEIEADIAQIRHELYVSGYASKMKNTTKQKIIKSSPLKFRTESGYEVMIGKNNTQNDELTIKTAEPYDWFFHVKDAPGSHVILFSKGEEPESIDFTQAAEAAAYYSTKREGVNVQVDYTQVKNIKKPSGSKPGFVTYKSNYSAVVSPVDHVKKNEA